MDLITSARVNKINQLAAAVLDDSNRQARRYVPGKPARLGLSAEDCASFKWSRAIQAGLGLLAGGVEMDCNMELARRFDMPPGCFGIPVDVLEWRALNAPSRLVATSAPQDLPFSEMVRSRSICFRLGVQRLEDLKDDVTIPRQVTDATLAWMAPNGSVTGTDSAFGQVSATPKTAVALTEVSEQLLRQTSADAIIVPQLAAVVSVGVDRAILSGAGGNEPSGIPNTPGIGTASGTSLGYAGLVGAQKTVADASAIVNPQALAYVTTPTVSELLKGRQRFTGTDSPLWRGALHEGDVEGVKAVASKQMPAATMLYGDFSTVYLAEWGPLMLSTDRGGTRFNTGVVGIRAMWMVDVIPTSPSSFVKLTSVT